MSQRICRCQQDEVEDINGISLPRLEPFLKACDYFRCENFHSVVKRFCVCDYAGFAQLDHSCVDFARETSGAIMNLSARDMSDGCRFSEGTRSYVDAVVFLIISTVAVFGNILVFVGYFKFKILQGITNVFILSLSASDLFVAFVSVPYSFSILVCDVRSPVDADNNDVLYSICDMVPSIWSIYSLALVALDRVLAISRPFFHQRYITRRIAWLSVVVIWVLALTFVTFKFLLNPRGFTLFIIIVAYFAPVSLMMASYMIIGYVAHVQAKKLSLLDQTRDRLRLDNTPRSSQRKSRTQSEVSLKFTPNNLDLSNVEIADVRRASEPSKEEPSSDDRWLRRVIRQVQARKPERPKLRSLRRELKSAITLALILGCFIVSWTPFVSVNIRFFVCDYCDIDQNMVKYFKILHYANSALNPILYVLLNRQWRAAFAGLLCGHKHRVKMQLSAANCGW